MSTYAQSKADAKVLMARIVDPRNGLVRFRDMASLLRVIFGLGFCYLKEEPYGPPGGVQIYYQHGNLLMRIKTMGEAPGRFRAFQPHMSLSLMDGAGLDWMNERAKFNLHGTIEAKAMGRQFNPIDFQGNPQKFVVILGGKYDGAGPDAWADRVHFYFPEGFDFSNVKSFRAAD